MVAVDFLNGVCAACDSADRSFLGCGKVYGRAVERYAFDIRAVVCLDFYDSILACKHLARFGLNRAERVVVVNGEHYGAAYFAYRKGELIRVGGAQVCVLVHNGQHILVARIFFVGRINRERAVLRERYPARERYAVCKRKDIGVCAAAEKVGKLHGLLAVFGVENVGGLCFLKLLYRLCRERHGLALD